MVICPKIPYAIRLGGAVAAFMVTTSIGTSVDWFAPKPFSAVTADIVQLDRVVVKGGVQLERVVVSGQRL